MTLYQQAKDLLWAEYRRNYEIVKNSEFHRNYADEKIKHSLQVAGAGNGILRHEAYFRNGTPDFAEIARTAILLHDIYRFAEIKNNFDGNPPLDHGVCGAEFLKTIPAFDNILITLPIKHHGHMIEELYADAEFQNIQNKRLKQDVEHIAFAIRDADKIANWYLVVSDENIVNQVWLPHPYDTSPEQAEVSELILREFDNLRVMDRKLTRTNADKIVQVIAWLFDINYDYSLHYAAKLRIFEKFDHLLERLGVAPRDIKRVETAVHAYLAAR